MHKLKKRQKAEASALLISMFVLLLFCQFVQSRLNRCYLVVYPLKLFFMLRLVLAELFKTLDEAVALKAVCRFALVELGGIVVGYVPDKGCCSSICYRWVYHRLELKDNLFYTL